MAWIERVDGGWKARWRDGRRKLSKTFARKADAQRFLSMVEADRARGTYMDPTLGKMALEAFWTRFEASAVHLRPSTRAIYGTHWRLYIEPELGGRALGSITRLDVETLGSSLLAAGTGAPTVAAVMRLLRRLLGAALNAGLVGRNVADGVKTPALERKEMSFLDPDEVARLVDVTPDRYRAMVLLAAYGGLRFGELAGLRVDRVDVLRARVSIEEALVEVRGELHRGPTKSGRSRVVTVPRFVAESLGAHIGEHALLSSQLLFTDPGGGPIRRTNFRRRVWLPSVRAAGLAPLRFHDLRHTAAALAIAQGAHALTIKERLGHSSITVTLDRYGHLLPSLDVDLAERLDVAGRAASGAAPSPPPEAAPVELHRRREGGQDGR